MSDWESAPVALGDNKKKFLDFLAKAEGADYNTITGGKQFNDFSQHPGVVGMVTKQGPSTAAGRYQITKSTYNDIAPKLGITDFSPESQDRIALELIKRNGALPYVEQGDYQNAIKRLGGTWASLPSSIYAGHPHRSQGWVEKTLNAIIPSAQATNMSNMKQQPAASGWEDVPTPNAAANNGGWEDAPTVGAKTQLPDIEIPGKKAAEPKSALKRLDDFVRGAADAITFGYADEIAAKMDQLTGMNTSGKGNAVPNTYDEALQLQRQRDKEGGIERTAGQLATAVLPTVGVVRSVDGATRLARAGAGAATGAIQGALYGSGSADGDVLDRVEGAAKGGATGAVAGGILGSVLPATVTQQGNSLIKKAGSEEAARVDAEIIRDLNNISSNPNLRGGKVQAVQMNALEQKYVNDATNAIKELGKDGLKKVGVDPADMQAALQSKRIITPDELNALRGNPAGDALADAIEKAQRTRSLTAANPADNNLLIKGARVASDYLLPGVVSKPINYMLNNRKSREEVVNKLLNNSDAAENVLERLGPSAATNSLDDLANLVQKSQAAKQAMIAQQQASKAAQLAQQAEAKNQILQQTRMPQGGGFQELLSGGASGLNMNSGQAIDALRTVSKLSKGTPVGDAAEAILKSQPVNDSQAFYGVQNLIRRLSEEGKVPGGASSTPGALSSGIRNPVSYAANVKNAEEALNIARQSAPTPELAQFASSVGRIKSSADKAKAIESRMAVASDPAEVQFLEQFVKPLANFGKK